MVLRIEIDRELCMGSGNCEFWAPGVFKVADDGVSVVLDPGAGPEDKILAAVEGCPTGAIKVRPDL